MPVAKPLAEPIVGAAPRLADRWKVRIAYSAKCRERMLPSREMGAEFVSLAGIVILGFVALLIWPSIERPFFRAIRQLTRRRS
jgi:hypothetical protein